MTVQEDGRTVGRCFDDLSFASTSPEAAVRRDAATLIEKRAGVAVEVVGIVFRDGVRGLRVGQVHRVFPHGSARLVSAIPVPRTFRDEDHRVVRVEAMGRHSGVCFIDDRERGVVEGRCPEHDAVSATALVIGLRITLFFRCSLDLQERQPCTICAPREVSAVGFLGLASDARCGRKIAVEAGLRVLVGQLGEHRSVAVPDLLEMSERTHRDDIAERLLHRFDPDVLPGGREVDARDHGWIADVRHTTGLDVDDRELTRRVPFEQLLIVGSGHQAGVRTEHVFAVLGLLDLRTCRYPRGQWPRAPVIRDEDCRDLPAITRPLEALNHGGQNGLARDTTTVSVARIRDVDVSFVLGVDVECEMEAIR